MLALCAELSWNIGMSACGVVSATVNAVPVIPGVVAISTNVGDFGFGEHRSYAMLKLPRRKFLHLAAGAAALPAVARIARAQA
jgi:hypothetical protein